MPRSQRTRRRSGDAALRFTVRRSITIDGLDIDKFLNNAGDLISRPKQATTFIEITANVDNGNFAADQTNIAKWQSEKLAKDIAGQFDKARSILGKQLSGQEFSYSIDSKEGKANSISEMIDKNKIKDTNNNDIVDESLAERLQLFLAIVLEKDQFVEMARLLAEFEKAAIQVGKQKPIASISYDPKYIISQKIVIKSNNQFDAFLSNNARAFQKKRSQQITLVAEPETSIHLSISPGVIYSFVQNPQFAAVENQAGEIAISKTEDNVAALSAAVALNFVPDKFFGEGVEPFLQVGVVPESDKPGIFLGVGFSAFKQVLLSGGIMYQRVNELGEGLSVGDVLGSVNDLKTDEKWETGLYLSIGVGFGI